MYINSAHIFIRFSWLCKPKDTSCFCIRERSSFLDRAASISKLETGTAEDIKDDDDASTQ